MSNTTALYWEASGVSLNTHAWNVDTKAPRFARPDKRGEDYGLPFRDGRMPVAKVRDSHVLPLPMWVTALNPDGAFDSSKSAEAKLHENFDYVMSLMDVEGQFPLVKRVYNAAGAIVPVSALAELVEMPEPQVIADETLGFTAQLDLADPYFYAAATAAIAVGTITVAGNARTAHATVTMGPGRFTDGEGNWVQFNGTGTVTLDLNKMEAKQGATFVNGLITRNTSFLRWPTLKPGSNALTGPAGSTISYEAAYK